MSEGKTLVTFSGLADSGKLMYLADWLDEKYPFKNDNVVQRELRRIAREIDRYKFFASQVVNLTERILEDFVRESWVPAEVKSKAAEHLLTIRGHRKEPCYDGNKKTGQ